MPETKNNETAKCWLPKDYKRNQGTNETKKKQNKH